MDNTVYVKEKLIIWKQKIYFTCLLKVPNEWHSRAKCGRVFHIKLHATKGLKLDIIVGVCGIRMFSELRI